MRCFFTVHLQSAFLGKSRAQVKYHDQTVQATQLGNTTNLEPYVPMSNNALNTARIDVWMLKEISWKPSLHDEPKDVKIIMQTLNG
jgi:NADPH-dependent 7-cyano-7-deazaguanine reductase QueF-like protein